MADPFDELLNDPQGVLSRLNPTAGGDPLNCPATADALENFLRTGQLTTVSDELVADFRITASWRNATMPFLRHLVLQGGHGTHIVVRGRRPPGSQFTEDHYFVLVNIHGKVYVADAWTHDFQEDIQEYVDRQEFNQFSFARHRPHHPDPFVVRPRELWE
jgi:hypothetical protein